MAITHQEIIDRMESLDRQQSHAYKTEQARIAKERESLRELCGSLGHLFAKDRGFLANGRHCLFCQEGEG